MNTRRSKQRRKRMVRATLTALAILSVIITFSQMNLSSSGTDNEYRLIISKSTLTRDILQDKEGCQWIKEEGEKMRPLIIDDQQVCVEGEE